MSNFSTNHYNCASVLVENLIKNNNIRITHLPEDLPFRCKPRGLVTAFMVNLSALTTSLVMSPTEVV